MKKTILYLISDGIAIHWLCINNFWFWNCVCCNNAYLDQYSSSCYIYTTWFRACQEQTSKTSFSSCIQILLFWESSLVHNAEFTVDPSPVSNAHSPFFCGFKSCQIQGFQECCITWKYASLTVELTVGRIQTFNCIGRVNNLSDIRWKLENRRYCIPVIIPVFHRIRVFCGPFFSNTI